MTPEDFKAAQAELELTNPALAREIGRSTSSVAKYRAGEVEVPPIVERLMRHLLAAKRGGLRA